MSMGTQRRARAAVPTGGETDAGASVCRLVALRGCLAALAAGRLLLGGVAAAAAAARLPAPAAAAALAAAARGALRVRDRRCPRLAHALLAKALVLLVVLDAGSVIFRHAGVLPGSARSRTRSEP